MPPACCGFPPRRWSAGVYMPEPRLALAALAAGGTLFAPSGAGPAASRRYHRARAQLFDTVAGFVGDGCSPSFTTDADGRHRLCQPAAEERFGKVDGQTLVAALGDSFASPAAVLYRLQSRAQAKGCRARGRGDAPRPYPAVGASDRPRGLSLAARGHHRAWQSRPHPGRHRPADADRLEIRRDPLHERRRCGSWSAGASRTLDRVFNDLPLRPGQVHQVAAAQGVIRARVAEFEGPTGRREIYLLPAEAEDDASSWSLADDFPVPMLKLTAQGRVLIANRRARDLLGPGTPEGRMMADLVEGLGRSVTDWMQRGGAGPGPEAARGGARRARRPRALSADPPWPGRRAERARAGGGAERRDRAEDRWRRSSSKARRCRRSASSPVAWRMISTTC